MRPPFPFLAAVAIVCLVTFCVMSPEYHLRWPQWGILWAGFTIGWWLGAAQKRGAR